MEITVQSPRSILPFLSLRERAGVTVIKSDKVWRFYCSARLRILQDAHIRHLLSNLMAMRGERWVKKGKKKTR
jgi:hypothetical protein